MRAARGIVCFLAGSVRKLDHAVFLDLDGHAVLDLVEEPVAQSVDRRDVVGRPDGGEDRAGRRQRIDRLGEQQRAGIAVDDRRVISTMPPVVEPIVCGRQSATPTVLFP